jgi:hypothetical protein
MADTVANKKITTTLYRWREHALLLTSGSHHVSFQLVARCVDRVEPQRGLDCVNFQIALGI